MSISLQSVCVCLHQRYICAFVSPVSTHNLEGNLLMGLSSPLSVKTLRESEENELEGESERRNGNLLIYDLCVSESVFQMVPNGREEEC